MLEDISPSPSKYARMPIRYIYRAMIKDTTLVSVAVCQAVVFTDNLTSGLNGYADPLGYPRSPENGQNMTLPDSPIPDHMPKAFPILTQISISHSLQIKDMASFQLTRKMARACLPVSDVRSPQNVHSKASVEQNHEPLSHPLCQIIRARVVLDDWQNFYTACPF